MELLEKVLSKENLNNAYKQVYKNRRISKVDGVTVDELFIITKNIKKRYYINKKITIINHNL